MNEVAVMPEVLYEWATGPVDAVADDLKTAFTAVTDGCEAAGLSSIGQSTGIAAALLEVTGADGAWNRDARFIRGRVYDFAEGLIKCGEDYKTADTANANHLREWFDPTYSDGVEPAELGDAPRYQDA